MSPSDASAELHPCWQVSHTWPVQSILDVIQSGHCCDILDKGEWCAVQKGWYRLGQALHGLGLYDEAVMALSTGETLEPE